MALTQDWHGLVLVLGLGLGPGEDITKPPVCGCSPYSACFKDHDRRTVGRRFSVPVACRVLCVGLSRQLKAEPSFFDGVAEILVHANTASVDLSATRTKNPDAAIS